MISPQTTDNKKFILKHPYWARWHIIVQAEDNEHCRETLSFNLRPFLATDYTTNEGLEADLDNPLLTTYIAFLNTYFSSLNMNLANVKRDFAKSFMLDIWYLKKECTGRAKHADTLPWSSSILYV